MYRILLIDDELIALKSMEHIVLNHFDAGAEIGKARSGREAISCAEHLHPQIVITDIKMPGINGLEAIREIKQICPDARFIVLSAYDQFEFAKNAIELGALEYLLKPANRAKVVEALERAAEQISKESARRAREFQLREKVERALPSLESGFVFCALFFDDAEGLRNYRELFDIDDETFYAMTLELTPTASGPESQIGVNEAAAALCADLRDAAKRLVKCYVGSAMATRIVLFVQADADEHEFTRRVKAAAFANELMEKLPKLPGVNLRAGIGRAYGSLSQLKRSYEESMLALLHDRQNGLALHIDDVAALPPERSAADHENRLFACLEMGDSGGAEEAFGQVFAHLLDRCAGDLDRLKCGALGLMAIANRISIDAAHSALARPEDDGSDPPDDGASGCDSLIAIIKAASAPEIRRQCDLIISRAAGRSAEHRKTRSGALIRRANEYIAENYSKGLALEDISRELNISPHYFCRLYKAETGRNFIDRLTELRIERAKALMNESSMSMKEIAYSVGYSDPNYFSRQFKRIVGETPTEYKDHRRG